MKLSQDIQLSENFFINEFLSNNDSQSPNQKQTINLYLLAKKLQVLRDIVKTDARGIDVNSGLRGVLFNKLKKGSSNSYHLQGLAGDIEFDFTGWTRESLTNVLKYVGFTNVNFYWNEKRNSWIWIHVDFGKSWNGEEFNYRDMDAITHLEIKL